LLAKNLFLTPKYIITHFCFLLSSFFSISFCHVALCFSLFLNYKCISCLVKTHRFLCWFFYEHMSVFLQYVTQREMSPINRATTFNKDTFHRVSQKRSQ
jgi:hypothetical protein